MIEFYSTNCSEVQLKIKQIKLIEIYPDLELPRQAINYLVQSFRKSRPNDLFFKWQDTIYVLNDAVDEILSDITQLDMKILGIETIEKGSELIIAVHDKQQKNLVKCFLGECIAIQLRLNNYLIEQKANYAFRATFTREIEHYGGLEAWPGFEYQFLIEENEIFVVIDPKYRLNWTFNLREDLKNNRINEVKLKYQPIKDICQILTCDERATSYYRCRLGGTGNIIYFQNLDPELPQEKFDVIDYLSEIHCPSQELKAHILEVGKEGPTVIASNKPFTEGVKYPLERLSQIPTLDLIRKSQVTKNLMKKIQPHPRQRYEKTKSYLDLIRKLIIDSLPIISLNEFSRFDDNNTEKLFMFDPKFFLFGNGETGLSSNSINSKDPYQTLKPEKLNYISYVSEEEDEKWLLSSLFEKGIFEGFFSFLGINKVELVKIDHDKFLTTNFSESCFLLLEDETQNDDFFKIRVQGIQIGNTIQKITLESFKTDFNQDNKPTIAQNHLRNVALGWLAKSNGIPFILSSVTDNNIFIIGWSIHYKKPKKGQVTQYNVVLSIYSSSGIHQSTIYSIMTKDDYIPVLSKKFSQVIQELIGKTGKKKNSDFFILKEGTISLESDVNIILKLVKEFPNLNMYFCSIVEGIFRIFKESESRLGTDHKRVNPGVTVKITDRHYIMITTSIKDSHIRDIYNLRTQQPISCVFYENYPNDIKESLLELIFHLTYCNHGFLNARTKVPLPLHSTKKAQEFFVSQEMQNGIVIESEREFFT